MRCPWSLTLLSELLPQSQSQSHRHTGSKALKIAAYFQTSLEFECNAGADICYFAFRIGQYGLLAGGLMPGGGGPDFMTLNEAAALLSASLFFSHAASGH